MYINRSIEPELQKHIRLFDVTALVGPRQAGKTTLMRKRLESLSGGRYFSFDDPDVLALFDRDIKHFERQYLAPGGLTGLDEAHYGSDAGRKLKYLADRGHRLVISSSSELLLSKQVLSQLVGRVGVIRLFPFSLAEFGQAAGLVETTPAIKERLLWEHAAYGGYPKAALSPELEDKRTILDSLYNTLLYKDVAQNFSITDLAGLERLVRFLAGNIGLLLSFQTAAKFTGISYPTLKKYLEALEKSYLIRLITPLATNPNKEIVRQPKIYFLDTGLRNAGLGQYPASLEDQGALFENYVFTELLKMSVSLKYWRTKARAEVDFVIQTGKTLLPIEVKLKPGARPSGLASFIEQHHPARALIVCSTGPVSERKVNGCLVKTIPADLLAAEMIANK
ncbi:ATP-binding protein [candidate division TA06 bacterium]|uniref:ATP-binding protein n=1 Tax=candidate division TA06 bacterium TaxID=2250710 RepID=A0A933MIH1_UNCT6|nr:ATP-binding protein [candidate division TA06 bacterium]